MRAGQSAGPGGVGGTWEASRLADRCNLYCTNGASPTFRSGLRKSTARVTDDPRCRLETPNETMVTRYSTVTVMIFDRSTISAFPLLSFFEASLESGDRSWPWQAGSGLRRSWCENC